MIIAGFECTECFVHQINKVISIVGENKSEKEKIEIFKRAIKFLSEVDFNDSPPEIARKIYNYLYKITDNPDPFSKIKEETNKLAEELINNLNLEILNLKECIKYAVAGNVIDFGIAGNKFEIEKIRNFTLYIDHFENFYEILKKSKKLLYIVDNSGEIIFDKLLLEKIISEFKNIEIFIAGRDKNIINDITKEDLVKLGFNNKFNVISTGYSGAGVLIEKCSNEFKNIFYSVDLIIAKGQGNFETLYGEKTVDIFYAFKIKCNHVAKTTGIPKNSNVFIYNKLI